MPQTVKLNFSISISPAPPPPIVVTEPDGTVAQPQPAINALPSAQVGVPVDIQLTLAGGVAPLSAVAISLPSGLSMDASGHITGTPDTAGDVSFEVDVTDAS